MNANHADVLENDQAFDEAVTAYLKAVDAGQSPNPQEWIDRYPKLAAELAEFFAGHEQLDRLTAPLRVAATSSDESCRERPPWRSLSAGDATTAGHASMTHANRPITPCDQLNKRFGQYELLDTIAHGGMGVVYKARHLRLNRVVALKLILSGQLARPADVERFHAEAEAAASLDHPYIVPIYEVGHEQGQHYFTMKFIEGGSLTDLIKNEPTQSDAAATSLLSTRYSVLSTWLRSVVSTFASSDSPVSASPPLRLSPSLQQRQSAELLRTVARAVHYAHQRGILHRDLKPSNILLDAEGYPYITDFGLAKRVGWDQRAQPAPAHQLTLSGLIVGTASYMAPEQAGGTKSLTTAADIYSLGAILYELLTGQPPLRAETTLETLLQVRERDPAPPRSLNPTINCDLETICLKCLEKDPNRRYASADLLADDLDRWLSGEPIAARPASSLERAIRRCRRNPLVTGLIAAVLLVGLFGILGILGQWQVALANEQKAVANEQKATANAASAQQNAQEANQQRDEAQRQRDEVKAIADKLQRTLYTAHVNLARHAWDEGSAEQVIDLLEQHRPKLGDTDLRNFEWHYLYRVCHAELQTLKGHTARVASVAYSPVGS